MGRLRRATVEIPYPWAEGEAHEIRLVSRNGVTFDSTIEVAAQTPGATAGWLFRLALLGFYVGVVPVALGLATYPFLSRLGPRGIDFVLALTVGLLVFLAIDTLAESLELAADVARGFHAPILVWIIALLLMQQPNLGETVIFGAAWVLLLALSGASLRALGLLAAAGLAALVLAYFFYDVARARIDGFLFSEGDTTRWKPR